MSSATQSAINYANYSGIYKSELAGAIIFAAVYTPLFFFNVYRSIRRPTYVLVMLAFFCFIRVVAFTLRAILAGSAFAGQNLNLLVAQQIIYSVGFFGLLYSAYTLVLDRDLLLLGPGSRDDVGGILGLVARLMRNRHIIRLALTAAVALGITGGVESTGSSQQAKDLTSTLRRASIIIFLVVSVMLVVVTARLALDEATITQRERVTEPASIVHPLIILLAIALLCVVREAFFTATSRDPKQQNNAHLAEIAGEQGLTGYNDTANESKLNASAMHVSEYDVLRRSETRHNA
ncbi:hypothetical protein EW026_g6981 [Hermanssonia centrifuga]|uniref:Uncharacterized protein n=1 Tax=Hermanssonia centrifuga TaxID=98765 RepID=A0A4S4K9B7_9APHY|nr:hypothetical protein EW026_g6981 [Hermanssonia centrifuga]